MTAALVLAAAVAASSAPATVDVSTAGVPFDEANYPKKTMALMRREEPCPKGGPFLKDLLFSTQTRWHGAVRKTSPARMEMIKVWTKDIGDPESAPKYVEEATFSEGRSLEWVAVPEGLLAYLQMDLQAGDRVQLFLILTGCAEGAPVWAVDEYEVPKQEPLEGEDELIYRVAPNPDRNPQISQREPQISPKGGSPDGQISLWTTDYGDTDEDSLRGLSPYRLFPRNRWLGS